MVARSLFSRVKSAFILKWLIKHEAKAQGEGKALLLQFIAEYRDSRSAFNILKRRSLKHEENIIRLTALEALGISHDARALSFLMKQVKAGTSFSYAAAISVLKLIREDTLFVLDELMTIEHEESSSILQLCLKFITRLPDHCQMSETIITAITRLLKSEIKQVRYLAVRCSSRIQKEDLADILMGVYAGETDPVIRKGIVKCLIEYLRQHPEKKQRLLSICTAGRKFFAVASRIFRRLPISPATVDRDLSCFLSYIDGSGEQADTARIMVVLRNWIRRDIAVIVRSLQTGGWDDSEKRVLLQIVNSIGINEMHGLSPGFMAGQYLESSVETKREYLRFFKKDARF